MPPMPIAREKVSKKTKNIKLRENSKFMGGGVGAIMTDSTSGRWSELRAQ